MEFKNNPKINSILYFILLFIFSTQANINKDGEEKYFFTIYPFQKNQTSATILHGNTPSSDFLTIKGTNNQDIQILKETTNEYIYKNISSVLLYEKKYLVKTCYGPNKIMEVIYQDDIEKKETQNIKYLYTSENNFNIDNKVVFCYSSIIKNFDNRYPDKNAIMAFFTEKNNDGKYNYKYLLFFPDSQRFSNVLSLHSDSPNYFSEVFPKYCTTFREVDIYCTINEETNQFVIETNKVLHNSEYNPSIFLIEDELNIGDGKNLKPIYLNYEYKSNSGGVYDSFLFEYHSKQNQETFLYYSLYRKSMRSALVPILMSSNLFQGIKIQFDYIGYNLFNILMPYANEAILIYIENNQIKATRVDYSISYINNNNLTLGFYSDEINENCKTPKFIQSSYITNYIKYTNSEQNQVNSDINYHYIYQKDIEVVLSCENSNNERNPDIVYTSKIIDLPQCLNELDSIHGLGYHKINFFLDVSAVVYQIYLDPRLKSFRNVGITFYPYDTYYIGLLFLQIKLATEDDYIIPDFNTLYKGVTEIKFERILPENIPFFKKPFYLNYRLTKINLDNSEDKMTSNLCSFQIKFYPFNMSLIQEGQSITNITSQNCEVDFCSLCSDNNAYSCEECDTSEISTLILYNHKCICDPELGFKKEPNLEYNICSCKEGYYYYNSIDLCWPKEKFENGSYYNETTDYNGSIIFYDCYKSCKKCSKGNDKKSHNCKECADGYYPLKKEMHKESFDCFGSIEEIINKTNKTNYYLNYSEKYWDECYESCKTCDSYGTKNKQNCNSCKPGYHFSNYSIDPKNCVEDLYSYENCTSTEEDIYKYNDFCHFCKEGYIFVNNTDKCVLEEELKNQSYYEDTIEIIKNYTTNETIKVTIYYPCHENCKRCKGKGDSYDNNCTECKNGYEFDINNGNKTCNKSEKNYEDIWFKLGKEIFYIYKQNECYFILYEEKIILISNENNCNSICPDWTNNVKDASCELKHYSNFENITREYFNNLLKEAYVYDKIKSDVSIILNRPEKNLYFHITNFVSESPHNLSSIHIDEFEQDIKKDYNISFNDKILAMKVDIKRNDTKSTQVEYNFYYPTGFIPIKLIQKNLQLSKRRLDGEKEIINSKIKLDLPVNFTEEQISKFDELEKNGYSAFNSSSEFYIDNCNQFTTLKGNDIYLEERKDNYYPDMTLCENGCNFVKYNNDTKKITCQCDFKNNTDNYEQVVFVKNPVDEKFNKKNFFENLQSMKCISKIFKPENLKTNPGFFIMIIFLLLFVVSGILYFILGGFLGVKNAIKEIDSEKPKNKDDKKEDNKESKRRIKEISDSIKENQIENNNSDGGEVLNINKGDEINNNNINDNQNDGDVIIKLNKNNKDKNDNTDVKKDIKSSQMKSDDFSESSGKRIDKIKKSMKLEESMDKSYSLDNEDKKENEDNKNNDNNNKENNIEQKKENEDLDKDKDKDKNNENDEQDIEFGNNLENVFSSKNSQIPKNKFENNENNNEQKDNKDIHIDGNDNNNGNDEDNKNDIKENNDIKDRNEINDNNKNNDDNNNKKDDKNDINDNNINNEKKENKDKNDNNENNNIVDIENSFEENINDNLYNPQNNEDNILNISKEINNNNQLNDNEQPNEEKDKNKLGKNEDPDKKSNYSKNKKYRAFDEYSVDSKKKDKVDGVSEIDLESNLGNIGNPPKKVNRLKGIDDDNKKDSGENEDIKLPSERGELKKTKREIPANEEKNCFKSLFSCGSVDDENQFKKLYIDDLKKHHILYYTFNCGDKENLLLKISFFAFSVHLYFGLNTILTFNLSIAESYFDKTQAKPGYIAMNLLLPFVICGLISFIIKILIMPQYFLARAEKKFDDLKEKMMKKIEDKKEYAKIEIKVEKKEESKEKIKEENEEKGPKKKKRTLNNKKKIEDKKEEKISVNEKKDNKDYNKEYYIEKELLKDSLFLSYMKTIAIYFFICFFVMAFNWYMMTSFCSIYRNTGIKLLVNSVVSLVVSFIIPLILGLIPTLLGFLAYKTQNKKIEKIYEIINFII